MKTKSYECCILGSGPAGLGVATELVKHDYKNILIIDKNSIVGGLSRTEIKDNVAFDIGPHRFFSNNSEVNQLWHDTLRGDFIPVDRLTRIYYKNKYFNYPIKALDTLGKLGFMESINAILSYVAANLKFGKQAEAETFEQWITQKFGRKLFDTFFKTYTEKVWGIPCNEIGAEWAAQRIKGLDIMQVIKNALVGNSKKKAKTLVEQFDYPRLGAGQMYEAMSDKVTANGVDLMMNSKVTRITHDDYSISSFETVTEDGEEIKITANHYFSSIPLTHFYKMLVPVPTDSILKATDALYYRDHITVDILVDKDDLFPDQWIYIHTPDVLSARLANYNNFSKAMVGHMKKTALSVEYFVFQHEDLWNRNDDDLIALAKDELSYLGLLDKNLVDNAWVVRETECYPTYYIGFQPFYELLKKEEKKFSNLYQIGRSGMYKYNNQDHSIMSGILAARNYMNLEGAPYDLWEINIDAEYHEKAQRV